MTAGDNQVPDRPALRQAAEQTRFLEPTNAPTRPRLLKRLLTRVLRGHTEHQQAFNKAILAALQEEIARADETTTAIGTARGAGQLDEYLDRHEEIASLRSDFVDLQQQLIGSQLNGSWPSAEENPVAEGNAARAGSQPIPVDELPGVNVFGDWGANTGLAQAARRLAVAMHDAGIEMTATSVATGAPTDPGRIPAAISAMPQGRTHAVDIWMLNANELPVVPEELLRPPGHRNYAVGVWYWELPAFPDALRPQIERVDEIWVATRFVQASFRRATTRPVHLVPAIVPELESSGKSRKDFGLSEDDVVFLFSFDINSIVARKNPGAVIEAFSRAFRSPSNQSPSKGRMRLVIKVLNLERNPEFASWLRTTVSAVDGLVIDDDLPQAELMDLFRCADVYVSLHRSEGFGFGIAEAMALGKPVIATAYSGNLDFATAANSCQVSYKIRQITSADHVYNPGTAGVYEVGALWADPDIDQAAKWMRLLASYPVLRQTIGEAARTTVRSRYSADAAVGAVALRLADIGARIGPGGSGG